MRDSQNMGKYGEDLAVSYLQKAGFEILERNYRYSHSEIDIIGLSQNSLLVFFEVKSRDNLDFGTPESFVDEKQQEKILDAADHYIHAINWEKDIRFDIIGIHKGQIEHIKDAFY